MFSAVTVRLRTTLLRVLYSLTHTKSAKKELGLDVRALFHNPSECNKLHPPPFARKAKRFIYYIPVSYTHLDVYKRQEFITAQAIISPVAKPFLKYIWRSRPLPVFSSYDVISDVYKRQLKLTSATLSFSELADILIKP